MLGEGPALGDRLGPLVLVMGKRQVPTASVQIKAVAEKVERHDHALGVPAGTTGSPGRVPGGLSLLGLLPEREVERGPLLLAALHPRSGFERVEALERQKAVARHLFHVEIDAVGGFVGDAAVQQVAHQDDHVVDVGRRMRRFVRAQHAQGVHGLPPARLELGSHLRLRPALLVGPLNDVVVDIGDVRHVADVEATEQQVAPQHVEDQVVATVTDVRQVVDGGAAHIHRHLPLGAMLQRADRARRGVVKA